ncbi:MAG TPA: collagen-like protein [Candidatus Baltobacteraceae bacterium]|nr:collagen-like protein [Candidatus Baltobacteraceae bacterium]
MGLKRSDFILSTGAACATTAMWPIRSSAIALADQFSRYSDNSKLVLEAIDITLSPDLVVPSLDLYVYADAITVTGNLALPSRKIVLFARRITFEHNAVVDVSGSDALQQTPARASDGITPGSNGAGGTLILPPPNHAGSITLYCDIFAAPPTSRLVANGGRGAPGQPGGYGAKGAHGANGANGCFGNPSAGPGATGGNGGHGEDGGPGGNGGNVLVIAASSMSAVEVAVSGGSGGAAGAGGSPGAGGDGGAGGPLGSFHRINQGPGSLGQPVCGNVTGNAPNAPPGNAGTPGPNGQDGPSGATGSTRLERLAIETFGSHASYSQLLIELKQARLYYYNGDTATAAAMLKWVSALAAHNSANATGDASAGSWSAVQAQTKALLANLDLGLDVYGYSPTFIPTNDLQSLETLMQQLITASFQLEASYNSFYAENQSANVKAGALASTVSSLQAQIQVLSQNLTATVTQSNSIQDSIRQLTASLDAQKTALTTADQNFRLAATRLAPGCNFLTLLETLEAMLVTGAGVPGAAADLLGVADAASTELSSIPGTIKTLTAVTKDVSTIASAVKSLSSKFANDDAKLTISEQDFDAVLQPYLGLQEAIAYRDLMQEYIATVKSRNQALLDFTGCQLQITTVTGQIKQKQAQVSQAQQDVALNADPTLPRAQAIVSTALDDSKLLCLQTLYARERVADYLNASKIALGVDTSTVSLISLADSNVSQQLQSIEQSHETNDNVPFGARPGSGVAAFTVAVPTSRESLQRFRNTGMISFEVTADQFRGWSFVRLSGARPVVAGIISHDEVVSIDIIHHGRSYVIDETGKSYLYSHNPRFTTAKFLAATGESLDEYWENLEVNGSPFLSPLAAWSIVVSNSENPAVDLLGVSAVSIEFVGVHGSQE